MMSRQEEAHVELASRVQFPCIPQAAKYARRYISLHLGTLREAVVYDIALLACELVTNSVLHSRPAKSDNLDGPRRIGLTLACTGSRVRIEVTDDGSDKSVPHIAEAPEEHGRGLAIVRDLSDDWGIKRGEGRTTVWFEKAISTVNEPTINPIMERLATMAISPAERAAENEDDSGEDTKAS